MDVEPKEYVDSTDPSDELIDVHEFWGDRCVIRYNLVKKHLGHFQACVVDVFGTDDVICNSLCKLREMLHNSYGGSGVSSAYGDLMDAEIACCEIAPLMSVCNERAINFFNEYKIKEEFSSFMKRMREEVSSMKKITC